MPFLLAPSLPVIFSSILVFFGLQKGPSPKRLHFHAHGVFGLVRFEHRRDEEALRRRGTDRSVVLASESLSCLPSLREMFCPDLLLSLCCAGYHLLSLSHIDLKYTHCCICCTSISSAVDDMLFVFSVEEGSEWHLPDSVKRHACYGARNQDRLVLTCLLSYLWPQAPPYPPVFIFAYISILEGRLFHPSLYAVFSSQVYFCFYSLP
ncbi:hypothetical protein P280DRAFT_63083 [Massarina eburnea CBS 473.64]|uniref:Uncharacterized protein n=1 Tax=Massarina eburnea CBS 473.64 TaxID=1395130 RepID=A0A6A6RWI8_9PLEO|nr:hypothetical protein P280DRAFT_63083 [Massarina eburnea CBS 473.64]